VKIDTASKLSRKPGDICDTCNARQGWSASLHFLLRCRSKGIAEKFQLPMKIIPAAKSKHSYEEIQVEQANSRGSFPWHNKQRG
jgi:ribosomal protein L40E